MKVKAKGAPSQRYCEKIVRINPPREYPWKVLASVTEDLKQFLDEADYTLLVQIIRDRDLFAYLQLKDIWGLQSVTPDTLSTLGEFRAKYLIASLLSKYQFDTERQSRVDTAYKKFVQAELQCGDFNKFGYARLRVPPSEFFVDVFTYAKVFLLKLLGPRAVTHQIMTRWSRHGPGANLDTVQGQTSTFFKYSNFPYSVTRDALPFARYVIETDTRWLGALQEEYRRRNNIPVTFPLDMRVFWSDVLKVVDGNRITFVPKNALTERSIAIEPALNLYLQLGVDGHIRSRLKRWRIDLDDQEVNQRLSCQGSFNSGDPLVTLDLSAASDTISIGVCRELLPEEWFRYLMKLRSPSGVCNGETISYEKMSSMGNGYTFVLETAIFTSLIYGVIRASGRTDRPAVDYTVYGDDIIIRRSLADNVIRALNLAGFSVNSEKSFLYGFARESCGTDWVAGKDVRPVFLKTRPSDATDLYVCHNRLMQWFWSHYSADVGRGTLEMLKSWLTPHAQRIRGPISKHDYGSYLHTPFPPFWRRGFYGFRRLIKSPVELQRSKFHHFPFRKLMHDLRSTSITPKVQPWEKFPMVRAAGGRRFAVVKSYSSTVSIKFSQVSYWPDEYSAARA